jgi:putative ABC transport system permease protein
VVNVSLYQNDWEYDMTYSPVPAGVRCLEDTLRDSLNTLAGVEEVSFFTRRNWSDFVSAGANQFSGETYGIDSAFFRVNGYTVTYGREFNQTDYDSFRKVVILDRKAAATLFGMELPIGRVVEIKGEPFTVVGVAEQISTFEPAINSYNDYYMYADTSAGAIFIPSSAWPMVFYFDEPQNVAVKATSTDTMTRAGKAVADVLNITQLVQTAASIDPDTGEELPSSGEFSYRSQDLLQQAQQLQEMSNATNQQLIWIASISLLVGGIGVMNIMLVSVTERTSEIGLKKAIGAKKRRIRMQFLTEAAVLTSLGGIIGVVSGIALAQLISKMMQIPVAIDVTAILVSVVFSMLIGVIFGLLPAVKAANLNPIEALRRE